MSQPKLAGLTSEDYTPIGSDGHRPLWYRVFQSHPGSNESFLRVIIDFDTHDTELTFGPLSAEQVDQLAGVLAIAFCHYHENWDGPGFESGVAQGLKRWEK